MTEVVKYKDEKQEEPLKQLKRFLRERSADNIISEIQGLPLDKAFKEVVKRGSDELVIELLNEHSWLLEEKWAANAIATLGSDKVCMYMIEKYPWVLNKDVAKAIATSRGDGPSIYIIDKYPGLLDKEVAFAIAKYRSDEVTMHMIDRYPEILDKDVAFAIAKYRSDEVTMHMIDRYPEVLKYEDVAKNIAYYRSDKVNMYMIEKYHEVLKYEDVVKAIVLDRGDEVVIYTIDRYPWVLNKDVAFAIAKYRSDEVTMHMIDRYPEVLKYEDVVQSIAFNRSEKVNIHMIEKHPELLGTRELTYKLALGLALTNKSRALAYILLGLGEIKPEDVDLIAAQFSIVLDDLNSYTDKEILIKRMFLNREAIGYKELNGISLVYRTFLELLNISKESAEKLAKELSKVESNNKKALPLRGLVYAFIDSGSGKILNSFIEKSRSVMNDLKIFPTVCELRRMNIISDSEFQSILASEDKEAVLYKQLVGKVESTFNVKPKSDDALKAMSDYPFLEDLFGLYVKYRKDKPQAERVLVNAIKHYFEGGIQKFKEFKFGGHELAKEQLSDAYAIKEKLMNLDKLAVTYTSKCSIPYSNIPYDSIVKEAHNFVQYKDALLRIFDNIEKDANLKLLEIARSAKSKKLASLLELRDLYGLTDAFDPDDEELKAKGIELIKLLKAKESFDYINNIAERLQKMFDKSKEEQDLIMKEIAKEVAEWVDKGVPSTIRALRRYISKNNKQLGISTNDLDNIKSTLDNAKSIVDALLNYSKPTGETRVTAKITFELNKILTFGRYGNSGGGNCQNSNRDVAHNQTLMSMLGDANQFMIVFYKANDTKDAKPLGFMQVHLLKSEKGMIFFMERPYTNEPDKITAMEEAARMLAQKIKNETGFDCFTYGEDDEVEEFEVEVPRSYVSRYIDFTGTIEDPESFKRKISAKCLTSDPFFGLKR